MNVSLTRARYAMYLVGNLESLEVLLKKLVKRSYQYTGRSCQWDPESFSGSLFSLFKDV